MNGFFHTLSKSRRAKNRSFGQAQDRRLSAPFDKGSGYSAKADEAFSAACYGCSMPMENIRSRSWRE